MKLIIGLGNPGEKHRKNRHNIGFMAVDAVALRIADGPLRLGEASKWQMENKWGAELYKTSEVLLAKPQTFMNDSGNAVSKIASFYKISPKDLYVIYDDLDLRLGNFKVQLGKGPRIHNGVNSVEESLGTKDFWHARVGVDNRGTGEQGNRRAGKEYVLEDFTKEEEKILEEVLERVVRDLYGRL